MIELLIETQNPVKGLVRTRFDGEAASTSIADCNRSATCAWWSETGLAVESMFCPPPF
jgi:hypothetical protein